MQPSYFLLQSVKEALSCLYDKEALFGLIDFALPPEERLTVFGDADAGAELLGKKVFGDLRARLSVRHGDVNYDEHLFTRSANLLAKRTQFSSERLSSALMATGP